MNRAERRRLQKKGEHIAKESVIQMKQCDVERIKQNATDDAIDKAFLLMLAIPAIIIHDKYSSIMKKEVDGVSREERFVNLCLDLYNQVESGEVSLLDIQTRLYKETGVKIERR